MGIRMLHKKWHKVVGLTMVLTMSFQSGAVSIADLIKQNKIPKPIEVAGKARILNLANLDIDNLNGLKDLSNPDILNILLSNNKITEIPDKVFSGFTGLTTLYLHGNPIKKADLDKLKRSMPRVQIVTDVRGKAYWITFIGIVVLSILYMQLSFSFGLRWGHKQRVEKEEKAKRQRQIDFEKEIHARRERNERTAAINARDLEGRLKEVQFAEQQIEIGEQRLEEQERRARGDQ